MKRRKKEKPKRHGIKPDPCRIVITIQRTIEPLSWEAWISYMRDGERTELVDAANAAGEMQVTSRFPRKDSPMPKVTPNYTPRKIGERD
jgi:hypothetical protein